MNASQKLEALENKIAGLEEKLDKTIELLFERLNALADTDVTLAKRINAIIKAGDSGGVSSESVKDAVVNDAAKELKAKVAMLVDNSILTLDNSLEIGDRTFVVGRELSSEGEEINPRIQFAVSSLNEEAKKAVSGKKAGEFIKDEATGTSLEILEVYIINEPKVEATPEATENEVVKEVKATKSRKQKKA